MFCRYTKEDEEQNLKDAGCDQALIEACLFCSANKDVEGELALLVKYRESLLETLHTCQRKIDCLEQYLRYF